MIEAGKKQWYALALLCGVQFMVVLDIAIVNVALPSIQTDLGFSQESLQWVMSAYALVFGGFLLLGGRAADLIGRRRIFVSGSDRVHARLASLRLCVGRRFADRLQGDPGTGRCDDLACGAVDSDDDLPGGP